ncbi:glycosyltransferase [Dehalococcoidia bacterium]|nr:glycosyltransferase [Dehalococcoidia bacterium]
MKLSVVIPTLNEESCIRRCLEAIVNNIEQPDEILVIDGFSTDATRAIAGSFGAHVYLNHARHAAPGRNVGIQNATGDVVVFTDADCVPRRDWLAQIKDAFGKDAELEGVGGPMVALEPRTRIEAFWGRVFLKEIMPFPNESFIVRNRIFRGGFLTANCAYQRKTLLNLGGFDEWFGNNAEDIDLFWRAIDEGAKLRYLPSAVVAHSFPSTLPAMIKKNFRNGVSSSKLQKRYGNWFQIDRYLYRALLFNVLGLISRRPDAYLYCIQLISHLLGKYYGSLRVGVINL